MPVIFLLCFTIRFLTLILILEIGNARFMFGSWVYIYGILEMLALCFLWLARSFFESFCAFRRMSEDFSIGVVRYVTLKRICKNHSENRNLFTENQKLYLKLMLVLNKKFSFKNSISLRLKFPFCTSLWSYNF